MAVDDEDLYAYADLEWMVIKTSDINAVVEELNLADVREGSFDDFGRTANTFVIPAWDDWIVIIHAWQPMGGSQEYLEAIEQVVTELSNHFGEAQAFAFYEEVIDYAHWVLAKDGALLRSFAVSSETEFLHTFGEVTAAEHFIAWEKAEMSAGSREVLKIARSWSIEPVYTEHPAFHRRVFDNVVGMVGDKHLQLLQALLPNQSNAADSYE